ncbi:glycerophosphodiester phosphodiesterase family protein [Olleya sp. 1-3]|uniref:glycerophosphodiester phosphodiesterase family protein n=1 Tax=Olleya sp. 1-3 TaxID=2058323 RepID=UPI000C33C583|nr:glycerophosphodiester phosphodiesterase family protein [Olleya sp. 1-3]PKG50453.1 glycerophosphodiester phosphodiesterase [Olleya sp. 1-3]
MIFLFQRFRGNLAFKNIYLAVLLVAFVSCKKETAQVSKTTTVDASTLKQSALIETFKYQPEQELIISVHRGGKGLKHYPENCLETLKYINDSIPAIYEIDIAQTRDNVLVLMHDNTLERTTTGTDKLNKYTYQELQAFNLEDDYGNETAFKIPTLKEVLLWAKEKNVVLTLDKKKSVSFDAIVALVKQVEAEDVSIIITYDLKQAEEAYGLAPNLMLSVSARNQKELDWLLNSKIPTQNMLAFTGTRLSPNYFYKTVQSHGIKTMLGTLGNLDKQAEAKGEVPYTLWRDKGIDLFATDRPFEVAKALNIKK